MDANEEPWARLPGEGARAFAAFCVYRDLGPERTLQQVRQECTKSMPLLKRWSAYHNWVERAAAYDGHLDRLKRQENERQLQETLERHANFGVLAQNKAFEKLQELKGETLTPNQALAYLEAGIKIERDARGVPPPSAVQRLALTEPDGSPARARKIEIVFHMPEELPDGN
jgi:hypothetical protein